MKCFVAAIAIGCVLQLRSVVAVEETTDLLSLIDDAMHDVATASSRDIQIARDEVATALQDVRRQLNDQPIGQWVERDMRFDDLDRQLAAAEPDLQTLSNIERGWQSATLRRLPVALDALTMAMREYLTKFRASRDADHVDACRQRLTELRAAWAAHRRGDGDFGAVDAHYAWLADNDAAPTVRAWLDENASWPNLWLEASKTFCESLLPTSIERSFVVDDNHDGTMVAGRGVLNGALQLSFEPNDDQAIAWLRFAGQGHTDLVGHRGSAKVDARSTLELRASQQFIIDDDLHLGGPADIEVHVGSEPLSATLQVRTPLVRQLGSRAALSVATRKRETNDRQAEERLRTRIEREFTGRLQTLTAALATFEESTSKELATMGLSAELRAKSTTASLALGLRLAGDRHLAAPYLPTTDSLPERAVRITAHESLLNNYATLMAGQTFSEADFRSTFFETLSFVPDENRAERGSGLAAFITLADEPLHVRLDDGCVDVELRIATFTTGNTPTFQSSARVEPWTVYVRYQVAITEGSGAVAIRVAPPTVEPRDAEGSSELEALMPRFFIERAQSNGISMSGEFARVLQLKLTQLTIDRGWATVVVQR